VAYWYLRFPTASGNYSCPHRQDSRLAEGLFEPLTDIPQGIELFLPLFLDDFASGWGPGIRDLIELVDFHVLFFLTWPDS